MNDEIDLDKLANHDQDPAIRAKCEKLAATCDQGHLTEAFLWRHGDRYAQWIALNPNWVHTTFKMPEGLMRKCIELNPEPIPTKGIFWKLERVLVAMTVHNILPAGHKTVKKLASALYKSKMAQFKKVAPYVGADFIKEEWKYATEKSKAWFLGIPNVPAEYRIKCLSYYLRRKCTYVLAEGNKFAWDDLKKIPGRCLVGLLNFLEYNKLTGTPWTKTQISQHIFSAVLKPKKNTPSWKADALKRDLEHLVNQYENYFPPKEVKQNGPV